MESFNSTIRIATRGDIEAIANLWFESAAYHGELDSRLKVKLDEQASVQKSFKKEIGAEDVLLLVATIEEEVIGYVLAKVHSAPPVQLVSKMGFIDGIAVTERYRRRGVGETLFRAALRWFKDQDISHVRVDVAVNNSEALKFWAKMKFTELSLGLSHEIS
ncbi:MAG: GNAT family N-acetyltransferase [Candidatus Thorarchaeota archaeon]